MHGETSQGLRDVSLEKWLVPYFHFCYKLLSVAIDAIIVLLPGFATLELPIDLYHMLRQKRNTS